MLALCGHENASLNSVHWHVILPELDQVTQCFSEVLIFQKDPDIELRNSMKY